MAGSRRLFKLALVCLLIGIVSCKKKDFGKKPPFPIRPLPPLLPPVPPIKQMEYLTMQQLAFIRHHQQLQKSEKGTYSPYGCLPKYICIVEDEAGEKRTTIVSSLHPALRDTTENKNDNPNTLRINVPQLAVLGQHDPEGIYRDRIVDDGFLKEQEEREKFALEQTLLGHAMGHFQAKVPASPPPSPNKGSGEKSSSENNSDESQEDKNEEDSQEDNNDSLSPKSRRRHPPPPPGFGSHSQEEPSSEDSAAVIVDDLGDHLATVPWNDSGRPKNQTASQGLSGALKIPFFGSSQRNEPKPAKRGFLRRMLFRGKREATEAKNPFMTKLSPGIKSSDQCRILYHGCDLKYDEIMQIASDGQVLIEAEDKPVRKPSAKPTPYTPPEDDEVDQAQKDAPVKYQKPIKQKPGLGFNKIKYPMGPKITGNPNSPYNKHIKMKPRPYRPAEDEVDGHPVASLPVLPMKFHFGKPMLPSRPLPPRPNEFNNDDEPGTYRPSYNKPLPPSTTTIPPPIFVKNPVYKKVNRTTTVTNIVQVNSTHALQIVKPTSKPYRPVKAPLTDKNGRPVSFASVFTEIAGSSGGIHDFFDKVAMAVGGPPSPNKRVKKQIDASPAPQTSISRRGGEVSSEEEDNEEDEEQDDGEEPQQQDEESSEDVESAEEEEDDAADDLVDEEPASSVASVLKKKPGKYTVNKKNNKEPAKDKNKNKKKVEEEPEDEEEDDEDFANDDVDVDVDLPDYLPDHIKQGILDDIKNPGKRQKEAEAAKKAEGEQDDEEGGDDEGGPPGPGAGPPGQGPGGPPGQGAGGPPGQGPGGPPGQRPQGFGHGQGPPGQGPPPSYFRQGQSPPPPRKGLFSSLF